MCHRMIVKCYIWNHLFGIYFLCQIYFAYKLDLLTRFFFIFLSTSIVFQPDLGLEFWYLLKITTDIPEATIMKEIYCDLGK